MDVQSDTKVGKDRPAGGRRFAWAGVGIRLFILLLIGALIFVVMREWDWWVGSAALQTTDDAYLQADTTPLAAKVPGYVRSVPVQDFQRVKAANCSSRSSMTITAPSWTRPQANVAPPGRDRQHRAAKAPPASPGRAGRGDNRGHQGGPNPLPPRNGAPADLLVTKSSPGRSSSWNRPSTTKSARNATLALNQRSSSSSAATECTWRARKSRPTRRSRRRRRRAIWPRSISATPALLAPVDGMVSERQVRPGQYLSIGTQVISLVPLPNVWVIANYKETQMTRIRIGQTARVTVDTFPGKVLHGHVDSWSPASGAEFCAAAARQRDRQLHQGRATDSGQDRARSRSVRWPTAAAGNVRDRDDRTNSKPHDSGRRQVGTR